MKVIYKIAALSLILGLAFTSCKEDEENFVFDNDLFTIHFSHKGFEKVHTWEGVESIVQTTVKDIASNDVISFDENVKNIPNRWISFSNFEDPYPVKHNLNIPIHQEEETSWRQVNNDRIVIMSDEIEEPFTSVDYFMDIEKSVKGPDSLWFYPPSADSILIGIFMWDFHELRMVLERDEQIGNKNIHLLKEYKFSRLVPQEFTFYDQELTPKVSAGYFDIR